MSRDRIISITSSIFILLIISFAILIPISYWKLIFTFFLGIICFVITYLIKKRSLLSINKRQVLYVMILCSILYVLLLVVLGIFFGFSKSLDIINKTTLIVSIIPTIIIIISIEIIRRVLLSQNTKLMIIMTFIIGVVSDLLIYSSLLKSNSLGTFMQFMGMVFLPSISMNVLFTYVSKKYGYLPNIAYRLIIFLYPYILTFDTQTPDIIESITKLTLPLLIFGFINLLYTNKHSQKVVKRSPVRYVVSSIFFVLIISIAMLMSCEFKYSMIVIGSGSMSSEIEIGDAIIYKKYDDKVAEVGDIIVFKKNNTVVVHRIVEIDSSTSITRYYTKGDALDHLDDGFVLESDILGYVTNKIVYIGYPTLWLREIFK